MLSEFDQSNELDGCNGNLIWAGAIAKDHSKVQIELKFLKPG